MSPHVWVSRDVVRLAVPTPVSIGGDTFAVAWAEGCVFSLDAALALALAHTDEPTAPP